MKRVGIAALVTAVVISLIPAGSAIGAEGEEMIITGVVDGPLSGGLPKAVELYAVTDIADLSDFGLGVANNGGGSDGEEFTFPADSASAGDFIYVATESTGFDAFFGFAPDYTDSNALALNGDDAVELFHQGAVLDIFGEIDADGTGTAWEYIDGWAKRVAGGPDGTTFVLENWSFSGPNALDGETSNDTAETPFPVGDDTTDPDPDPDPEPAQKRIHEVQGSGADSPLEGERVIVEGVVVGDQETFDRLAGFFVQEEDVDTDDDPSTSEGVFVFNHANDDVDLGDVVRVEGTVDERFGNTQLTDFVEVEVIDPEGKDRTVTPAEVTFPLTETTDLEAVEGMSAHFSQTLVVSEYFNYDRFGEVVVALPFPGEDRPYTPTAVEEPGSAAMLERLEWNNLSRITIDDAMTDENPDTVVHPINRDPFTLENRFRGGDEVTGLVGPVYFDFGLYRLLPTGFDEYDRTERPAEPDAVGGRLRVATLNALNYFLTLDDGSDVCGADQAQGCRGADTPEEFERQRAKLLEALIGLDSDVVGLVEVENTPGVSPLADIVAGLNEELGARTYDYISTGAVGSDAIKVGIIYRPAAVTPTGQVGVLDDPAFLDPTGSGVDRNRPAVAASFLEKRTGERFSVVVNHLKSKGSSCGPGDDDPYAGNCNLTRTLAAEALSDWLETNPTNSSDGDWLIVGDLNSYDKEDPIDVLDGAGYTDLLAEHEGELAYSFVFDGQFGYLDYAMSSASMTSQVTGATAWHINADEPDILDYDMTFKSDAQDALFAVNPYRSSDHDAVVVGLSLDQVPGRGNH